MCVERSARRSCGDVDGELRQIRRAFIVDADIDEARQRQVVVYKALAEPWLEQGRRILAPQRRCGEYARGCRQYGHYRVNLVFFAHIARGAKLRGERSRNIGTPFACLARHRQSCPKSEACEETHGGYDQHERQAGRAGRRHDAARVRKQRCKCSPGAGLFPGMMRQGRKIAMRGLAARISHGS